MSNVSSSNIPIKLLSEALSEPIVNTYKAGGLGLALLLIGTLLTLVAFFFGPSLFGYAILFVGVFLILVLVFLLYLQGIRPLQHGEAQIKKNEEIVNTVQTSAMDMVDLAGDLNRLTFAHVGDVAAFITQYQQVAEETLPYVQQVATLFKIPGAHEIGEMVNNKYVLKEKALLASILLTTDRTREILEKIKDALSHSNVEPLKEYQGQVKELSQNLQELLKTVRSPT
jgi:hypothetical protein